MNIKKHLMDRTVRFIKKKKPPKRIVFFLLVVALLLAYALELIARGAKLVCNRRKTSIAVATVMVVIVFATTYFFYYQNQAYGYVQTKESTKELETIQEPVVASSIENMSTYNNVSVGEFVYKPGLNRYYVKVNRIANCVTVYTYDVNGEYTIPVKAMVCSVGRDYTENETPIGVFKTGDKAEWCYLADGSWGQYSFRIHGGIMFHSVPYYSNSKTDLETQEYNKLGEGASMGCVRLTVEDAKWLYDNCDRGTLVEIYGSEDPGPLGKPEAQKIADSVTWDPTDIGVQ